MFKINDLLNLAECKLASYDSDTINTRMVKFSGTSECENQLEQLFNNNNHQLELYNQFRPFNKFKNKINLSTNQRSKNNWNNNQTVPNKLKSNYEQPKSEQLARSHSKAEINCSRPILGQALFNNTQDPGTVMRSYNEDQCSPRQTHSHNHSNDFESEFDEEHQSCIQDLRETDFIELVELRVKP
ncbi:hypothetical protein BpHYR1_046752 [Brachionus plicatilis]|uniref:Uncharacterized protein n=1 Tax=Brachionus plicatilis TaxID=10195 RepID=A0A3M7QU12_BRAPC|nr:hypothetical protein BpHYR1_046752 [Brachionus plicatilis]